MRREGVQAENGPVADSSPADVVVRKDFPETWIWDDVQDVEYGNRVK